MPIVDGHPDRDAAQSPHQRAPSAVELYAAAFFRPPTAHRAPSKQTVAAATYAVYLHTSEHHLRLAQPLVTPHQTYRTAVLQSVLSALELANCLCLPYVRLCVDDAQLVNLFHVERPRRLADTVRSAPADFASPEDMALWRAILSLADTFSERGATLQLIQAQSCQSLRTVRSLCESAVHQHEYCSNCECNYGPLFTPHDCGPAYQPSLKRTGSLVERTDAYGRPQIVEAVCPRCSAKFQHLHQLERHVESDCPELLDEWFAHTKIVKD
ncbi:hypothetical protein BWQ96_03255 [Gracilariopsis chorda]|uniref:C2H2-type domain-containing protein n=1 Tax=Gracilariopsis chorda TaxID=448386 RepID=A0A2V3IZ05_9FLOR|nr:hypothetical protein BWQ96_03255 [Gracilariopsis chorda]|eukprot:PXF46917.1 hypothetical protein BWQ96_03255 [Gracilariopsis chorda]